ncbi:hypothetical protein HQ576_18625 [bacterium]|nr:hypothetical protein [bacterium]
MFDTSTDTPGLDYLRVLLGMLAFVLCGTLLAVVFSLDDWSYPDTSRLVGNHAHLAYEVRALERAVGRLERRLTYLRKVSPQWLAAGDGVSAEAWRHTFNATVSQLDDLSQERALERQRLRGLESELRLPIEAELREQWERLKAEIDAERSEKLAAVLEQLRELAAELEQLREQLEKSNARFDAAHIEKLAAQLEQLRKRREELKARLDREGDLCRTEYEVGDLVVAVAELRHCLTRLSRDPEPEGGEGDTPDQKREPGGRDAGY